MRKNAAFKHHKNLTISDSRNANYPTTTEAPLKLWSYGAIQICLLVL